MGNPRRIQWDEVDRAVEDLVGRLGAERFLLGLTGPPGAGKSTLAQRIVESATPGVGGCVAAMDGFHRSNEELSRLGLLALKGVPASFDGEAFAGLLRRVAGGEAVDWPTYDRARQEVVPGGARIGAGVRLVVVEGNYLLLDEEPWGLVAPLLDEVWYLDVPEETLVARLLARQQRGRTLDEAREKVRSTDLPNAALVAATMHRADLVVTGWSDLAAASASSPG